MRMRRIGTCATILRKSPSTIFSGIYSICGRTRLGTLQAAHLIAKSLVSRAGTSLAPSRVRLQLWLPVHGPCNQSKPLAISEKLVGPTRRHNVEICVPFQFNQHGEISGKDFGAGDISPGFEASQDHPSGLLSRKRRFGVRARQKTEQIVCFTSKKEKSHIARLDTRKESYMVSPRTSQMNFVLPFCPFTIDLSKIPNCTSLCDAPVHDTLWACREQNGVQVA